MSNLFAFIADLTKLACIVLSVSQLSVQRGLVTVVNDLSLAVAPGEIVALIGPNGAGKSTALKAILGLLPYTGRVLVDGLVVAELEPRARARRLAYVPQRSQLAAGMSARNVVAQGRFAHLGELARLGSADQVAIASALTRCSADGLAERPFTHLSVGEQQRVLLARALASEAAVVLLDEPTAALDVGHALALLALLRALADDGKALLVVLHDLDQVTRLADRVILLDRGQVRAQGSVASVLTAEHLAPSFGVVPVPASALGFAVA